MTTIMKRKFEAIYQNYDNNNSSDFESPNPDGDDDDYHHPKNRAKIMTTTTIPQQSPRSLKMVCGSFYIPKTNPSKPLGEDSHLVWPHGDHGQTIAVADGVGGWASRGIDAGDYARELMTNCLHAIDERKQSSNCVIDPKQILVAAHANTAKEGSSTACVVSFDGQFLRAANVGDSGFMIFRDGKLMFESPIQQYRFNYPYQMCYNSEYSDNPEEVAWEAKIPVKAGDIIVLGTDGLLDNMFPAEIEKVIPKDSEEKVVPRNLATQIAGLALYNSYDETYDSPFTVGARKAGLDYGTGGKLDDITVVVAQIVASSDF